MRERKWYDHYVKAQNTGSIYKTFLSIYILSVYNVSETYIYIKM